MSAPPETSSPEVCSFRLPLTAAAFGVHPVQITQWKKRALTALPEAFATRRRGTDAGQAAVQAGLYEEIGRLKVELDWMKRKHELVDR